MSAADFFVTLVPALVTAAFAIGLLRATTTMAPPSWAYWLPVVFSACCLVLPLRYGPGFKPDDPNAQPGVHALTMDLLLFASFSAVALGLSLHALRVRAGQGPAKAARVLLVLSALATAGGSALAAWRYLTVSA